MSIHRFARRSIAFPVVAFLIACSGVHTPPAPVASNSPAVLMVVPQTNGVGTDRQIAVVFSKPMDPASINSSTFVITGMTGAVTYDATNKIGAFKPSPDFAPNTKYNASITVGAKDLSGTPLAAPFDFSFTTRPTSDTSPPHIVAVNVAAGATCVPLDQKILATFDEQMDSLTINPSTFFIVGVTGTVTYDASRVPPIEHA